MKVGEINETFLTLSFTFTRSYIYIYIYMCYMNVYVYGCIYVCKLGHISLINIATQTISNQTRREFLLRSRE